MVLSLSALMEYLDDFTQGSLLIPPITLKSKSTLYYTYYTRQGFTIKSISRVLLATIRNLGSFPCPRCMIPKEKIPELGTKLDGKRRETNQRYANSGLFSKIRMVRSWIYKQGLRVKAAAVERLMSPASLVPTIVRILE